MKNNRKVWVRVMESNKLKLNGNKSTAKAKCNAKDNIELGKRSLESYLLRREKEEAYNNRAFQQARNMSGWLSVYKYGAIEYRKIAAKVIMSWAR